MAEVYVWKGEKSPFHSILFKNSVANSVSDIVKRKDCMALLESLLLLAFFCNEPSQGE